MYVCVNIYININRLCYVINFNLDKTNYSRKQT